MSKLLRTYRAMLLGRMDNTNKELEYYKKNLKYMDENPGKYKNEKTMRECIAMCIEDLTENYNKMLAQLEIIDKDLNQEEENKKENEV